MPGELVGLDEHSARPAAGVEHHAALRLQHPHQRAHDGHRREVLAATLALRRRELADEVLINPSDQVFAAVVLLEDILRE